MNMKKLATVGIALLTGITLTACGNSSSSSSSKSSSSKSSSKVVKVPAKKQYYFKDSTVKLRDLKIVITKTKVIQAGEKGNAYGKKPVITFWYKTTNLTNKDIDPTTAWTAVFEATQDTNKLQVTKLKVAALPDDKYLDTQTEKIKKDKTAENAVAYDLDSTTQNVLLTAYKGVGGTKLGSQTYKLK